jgi:hypothetical protein
MNTPSFAGYAIGEVDAALNGTSFYEGNIVASNTIGPEVDYYNFSLLDATCTNETEINVFDSVLLFDIDESKDDSITYTIEVIESHLDKDPDGFVTLFTTLGTNSEGTIDFCTRVTSFSEVWNATMGVRDTKFELGFNMSALGFFFNDIAIEENPIVMFDTFVDATYTVHPCQCENYDCITTSSPVVQNEPLMICLTPSTGLLTMLPTNDVEISNFDMKISAGVEGSISYVEYSPVWFGADGAEHNILTTISVMDRMTVEVTTALIADFYIAGHTSVMIEGNSFLVFKDARGTTNDSYPYTFTADIAQPTSLGCFNALLRRVKDFF